MRLFTVLILAWCILRGDFDVCPYCHWSDGCHPPGCPGE